MARQRIDIGQSPAAGRSIHVGQEPQKREIPKPEVKNTISSFAFSLKYFKQIKYFEVGQQNKSWYISLIDRLQELSNKSREAFLKDSVQKDDFRYHDINWNSKNVPIKKSDLNWVDKAYLDNGEDYPFVQFHVSKALGRVVGFWDHESIFQIVLLDPLHNIQPSKYNNYKVKDTHFMSCEISSLFVDLNKVKAKIKEDSTCQICKQVQLIPTKANYSNLLVAHLDDSYMEQLEKSESSIEDILEIGLLYLGDKKTEE